jgi:hypothetical protein
MARKKQQKPSSSSPTSRDSNVKEDLILKFDTVVGTASGTPLTRYAAARSNTAATEEMEEDDGDDDASPSKTTPPPTNAKTADEDEDDDNKEEDVIHHDGDEGIEDDNNNDDGVDDNEDDNEDNDDEEAEFDGNIDDDNVTSAASKSPSVVPTSENTAAVTKVTTTPVANNQTHKSLKAATTKLTPSLRTSSSAKTKTKTSKSTSWYTNTITTKISYAEILKEMEVNTKGITPKMEGNEQSFTKSLFAIRRARHEAAWKGATLFTATGSTKEYDLLCDFTRIKQDDVYAKAKRLWSHKDSAVQMGDWRSELYIRRLFAIFLFHSFDTKLARQIQTKIPEEIINDGPSVWMALTSFLFSNTSVFTINVTTYLKTLVVKSQDFQTYLSEFNDYLSITDDSSSKNNEINMAFLTQLMSHPNTHFSNVWSQKALQYFMDKTSWQFDLRKGISDATDLLGIIENPRLPFHKMHQPENNILAMLSSAATTSADGLISASRTIADLQNQHNALKAEFTKFKALVSTTKFQRRPGDPEWVFEAPTPQEAAYKDHNHKRYYWCAFCGMWRTSHSTNGDPSIPLPRHGDNVPSGTTNNNNRSRQGQRGSPSQRGGRGGSRKNSGGRHHNNKPHDSTSSGDAHANLPPAKRFKAQVAEVTKKLGPIKEWMLMQNFPTSDSQK